MGQTEAMTNLGAMYEKGHGGLQQDGTEAIRWWTRAAEVGDPVAQRMLAAAYSNGTCRLQQNEKMALHWWTRAAEQEDIDAMYLMSVYFSSGSESSRNYQKAFEFQRRAAELGHAEAQNELAASYLLGELVDQNEALAALWYRRASIQGHASAQCNLGAFYAKGLGGLTQNLQEALRLYESASSKGNADAQHNLALMYAEGLGGLVKDPFKSHEWCLKAAEQGHPKALAILKALPAPMTEEPRSAQAEVAPSLPTDTSSDQRAKLTPDVIELEEDFLSTKVEEVLALLQSIQSRCDPKADCTVVVEKLIARTAALKRCHGSPGPRPDAQAEPFHVASTELFETIEAVD